MCLGLCIPLHLQFDAAIAASSVNDWRKVHKILSRFGFPSRISPTLILKYYLSFTGEELITNIKKNPEIYEYLLIECEDKRYSPSSVIIPDGDLYFVGTFSGDTKPSCQNGQVFLSKEEAASDYILHTLRMPRLRKKNDVVLELPLYNPPLNKQ